MKNFLKFINLEPCNEYEFSEAQKYYNKTQDYIQKKDFLSAVAKIILLCLKKMEEHKTTDFLVAKDIYETYGMTKNQIIKYIKVLDLGLINKRLQALANLAEETKLENAFLLAKNSLWNQEKIKESSINMQSSAKKILDDASKYARNYLHMTIYQYKEYKKLYKSFHDFIHEDIYNKYDNAYLYYQTYATTKEKEAFQKTIAKIFGHISNLSSEEILTVLNVNNLNPIIIYKIAEMVNLDENLRRNIIILFKSIYEDCNNANWDKEQITQLAKKAGIRYLEYKWAAKTYAKEILHIEHIDTIARTDYIQKSNFHESKTFAPLRLILASTDPEECFRLFSENDISTNNISSFVYSSNKNLSSEEQTKMYNDIMSKRLAYQKKAAEIRAMNKPKQTKNYEAIFLDFINGSYSSIKEYCKKIGISPTTFQSYLKKLDNKELLEQVNQKIMEMKQNRKNNLKDEFELIVYYLNNGIEENGILRKFDLIDFFVYFPDLNFQIFYNEFIPVSDRNLLFQFFAPLKASYHRYDNNFNENRIINSHISIENKFGKKVFTKSELTYIMDFFRKYNLPKSDYLFNIALKRFMDGTLILEALQEDEKSVTI